MTESTPQYQRRIDAVLLVIITVVMAFGLYVIGYGIASILKSDYNNRDGIGTEHSVKHP